MIINDKLKIFESLVIDRKLPKFTKNVPEMSDGMQQGVFFGEISQFVVGDHFDNMPKTGFWIWLRSLFTPKAKPGRHAISIAEFFTSVKNSAQELEVVRDRAENYERAMVRAQKCGQAALLESLQKGIETNRGETQLVAIGSRQYLTEEDVVRFVKATKKGIRLDWIRNFTRMIPSEIIERKTKMDELGIFDNYAVMHYDPDKKSWSETQAEIAARKDPILFGLMVGSRKLYLVGDWIDEQCDLTLEQIVDNLGTEVVRVLA
jgi:hypothetical protein